MALKVKLILLQPGHIKLLPSSSTLELPCKIFLVVTNDPEPKSARFMSNGKDCLLGYNTRCTDTLGSLGDEKLASFFDWPIDVVAFIRNIR